MGRSASEDRGRRRAVVGVLLTATLALPTVAVVPRAAARSGSSGVSAPKRTVASGSLPAYCSPPGADTDAVPLPADFQPLVDPNLVVNVIPDPKRPLQHQLFVDAIKGASSTIQLTMFHLVDVDVVAALCDAARRLAPGKVQIIVDRDSLDVAPGSPVDSPSFNASNEYNQAFTQLKGCGAAIVPSTAAFSITHEKAMTADWDLPAGASSRVALVTSSNLVHQQAALQMSDFELQTRDAGVIAEHHAVFETDLQNAQTGAGATPELTNPHLLWSPQKPGAAPDGNGNSEQRLAELINSARSTLRVTVENFSSQCIQKALGNALARGVTVEMLVPECVAGTTQPTNFAAVTNVNKLAKGKVVVRVMPGAGTPQIPYLHAKMILADLETQPVFYVGSENYSLNSLENARECGMISSNAQAAATIYGAFRDLLSKSVVPPASKARWGCSVQH